MSALSKTLTNLVSFLNGLNDFFIEVEGKPDKLQAFIAEYNSKANALITMTTDGIRVLGEYLTDEGLLYIGEGDPVLPRLQSHSVNKDFWTYAVVFTSKDENLTKTQIQYIESRLIKLSIDSRRIKLDNSREEDIPSISESGQCEVELFLDVILDMLHALRFNFFEPLSTPITVDNNDITYEFKVKKAYAKMIIKNGKYILLKDSTVQGAVTPRAKPNIIRLREKLINDGLIIPHADGLYIVTSNIEFNSSSYAADVVAGYNVNGLDVWKYNNQSLKELENQA